MWVWVFAAVRLRRAGVRTLDELRSRIRDRSVVDLELLVFVAAVGSIPGFLVAIGGQSTGYFSDPQRWLAIALLLALLAVPAKTDEQRARASLWEMSLGRSAVIAGGVMLACVAAANVYFLLKQFAKSNIATRRALFGSQSLVAVFRPNELAAERLRQNPAYQLLQALRRLDALPLPEKAASALFVPRSNQLYWSLLPECLTPPFVGPALSSLPMISGLPAPECERQRLGYWTYRLRSGGWGDAVDPGQECQRAAQLGFRRVFRLEHTSAGVVELSSTACDASPAR
jgi:hypothetical protein